MRPPSATARPSSRPSKVVLPAAVRSDQAVDLTLRHIQVDAVECDDIAEALGDPTGPDREESVHSPFSCISQGT